ncbi:MAG: hypothetical protein HC890_17140 [Chloroflexaceae bacterium]|nr:hypothetical protein [Chloroflexaceae bacterium]
MATEALSAVTGVSLEGQNDRLTVQEFGFSLSSRTNTLDGVNFSLAPGGRALLSVTQDGVANPRQLHVGRVQSHLSPGGWILNSTELGARPSHQSGEAGLFAGQGETPGNLEFRWTGGQTLGTRQVELTAIAAERGATFTPVSLDQGDRWRRLENGVEITGQVGRSFDGLDIQRAEAGPIGFAYEQDGLVQPSRVDLGDPLLETPNAYWVPLATPYGRPEYDPAGDAGLFLWKEAEGNWHLRAVGGDRLQGYRGRIVSDRGAELVDGVGLEANDRLDTTTASEIAFAFNLTPGAEDGINFRFGSGAALSLILSGPEGEPVAESVRIGAEQWRVSALPLDLSGWA